MYGIDGQKTLTEKNIKTPFRYKTQNQLELEMQHIYKSKMIFMEF